MLNLSLERNIDTPHKCAALRVSSIVDTRAHRVVLAPHVNLRVISVVSSDAEEVVSREVDTHVGEPSSLDECLRQGVTNSERLHSQERCILHRIVVDVHLRHDSRIPSGIVCIHLVQTCCDGVSASVVAQHGVCWIAEVVARQMTLDNLQLQDRALVVVMEQVEKPGNVGAVLRSADAANADAVIVCDPLTDLYNPNLIRASVGAFFSVPCVACTSEECIKWLKKNGIQILTAQLQDSELYYDTDMRRGTAIVMGTEATGLTDVWREAADAHIRIPMLGRLDSLNVSVSAAILLYEAVRQRGGTQEG